MNTELIDISPTRKELRIEIDAAAVRAQYDLVSDRYAKRATVPGFRPGHAPVAIVRQRYKKEIRGEVLSELVPQAVSEAITERALNVIGEPDVQFAAEDELDHLGQKPLALHARLEVLPEVTLDEYRGLEVARRVRPITDRDVEEVIGSWHEGSASLQPVEDRGARTGDTVTANYLGRYINPPEQEEINVEEVDTELGGEGVLEDFTNNLLDTRPDDERTFTIRYPEDFKSKGLAGKEIEYTAKVVAVRVKELPELNDEWAKSLGEEGVDSLEALRAKVREALTERARAEAENLLRETVVNKLVEAHPVEVPQTLLQRQAYRMMEATVRDMMTHGIDPRDSGVDGKALYERVEQEARRQLQGSLLLEHIAERENIEPTDEEMEAEIAILARVSNQPIEQVRATLTKEGVERSIADRLRTRKALDFVVENARVSEEDWREEEVGVNSLAEATQTEQTEEVAADQQPSTNAAEQDASEARIEESTSEQRASGSSPQ